MPLADRRLVLISRLFLCLACLPIARLLPPHPQSPSRSQTRADFPRLINDWSFNALEAYGPPFPPSQSGHASEQAAYPTTAFEPYDSFSHSATNGDLLRPREYRSVLNHQTLPEVIASEVEHVRPVRHNEPLSSEASAHYNPSKANLHEKPSRASETNGLGHLSHSPILYNLEPEIDFGFLRAFFSQEDGPTQLPPPALPTVHIKENTVAEGFSELQTNHYTSETSPTNTVPVGMRSHQSPGSAADCDVLPTLVQDDNPESRQARSHLELQPRLLAQSTQHTAASTSRDSIFDILRINQLPQVHPSTHFVLPTLAELRMSPDVTNSHSGGVPTLDYFPGNQYDTHGQFHQGSDTSPGEPQRKRKYQTSQAFSDETQEGIAQRLPRIPKSSEMADSRKFEFNGENDFKPPNTAFRIWHKVVRPDLKDRPYSEAARWILERLNNYVHDCSMKNVAVQRIDHKNLPISLINMNFINSRRTFIRLSNGKKLLRAGRTAARIKSFLGWLEWHHEVILGRLRERNPHQLQDELFNWFEAELFEPRFGHPVLGQAKKLSPESFHAKHAGSIQEFLMKYFACQIDCSFVDDSVLVVLGFWYKNKKPDMWENKFEKNDNTFWKLCTTMIAETHGRGHQLAIF